MTQCEVCLKATRIAGHWQGIDFNLDLFHSVTVQCTQRDFPRLGRCAPKNKFAKL